MDFLAVLDIRGRERHCLGHRRMFQQGGIHFERGDLFAAAIGQLLDSSGEHQAAVLVEDPLIAGAKITIAKGRRVRKWDRVVPIVVRDEPSRDEDRLRAFLSERLIDYQRSREIRFVDALPRNAMGKVLRRELRTWIEGGNS